jgi:hypothetical protein
MRTLFILLVAFQLKHWLCDYRFQTPYMLGKFKPEGWLGPLVAHAGAHGFGTLFIILWYGGLTRHLTGHDTTLAVFFLALADFAVHFIVDRVKVVAGRGLTPAEPRFWRQLGADQAAHHLTHYAIIYVLLAS